MEIPDPKENNLQFIGKLLYTLPGCDKKMSGTACLIQNNVALTCAHNFYNR